MTIQTNWKLEITLDQVLQAQGANAEILKKRSPRLVDQAQQALEEAIQLAQPVSVSQVHEVSGVDHSGLLLSNGVRLNCGKMLAEGLAPSSHVYIIVCTVGESLERRVTELMRQDLSYAFALDSAATAAIDSLSNALCKQISDLELAKGHQTTLRFSPGMDGWNIEHGQPLLFSLLKPEKAGISLTSSFQITPRKSTSFIIGAGSNVTAGGRLCDYCVMRTTCTYRSQYEHHETHG